MAIIHFLFLLKPPTLPFQSSQLTEEDSHRIPTPDQPESPFTYSGFPSTDALTLLLSKTDDFTCALEPIHSLSPIQEYHFSNTPLSYINFLKFLLENCWLHNAVMSSILIKYNNLLIHWSLLSSYSLPPWVVCYLCSKSLERVVYTVSNSSPSILS